jgi:hypothetical protein
MKLDTEEGEYAVEQGKLHVVYLLHLFLGKLLKISSSFTFKFYL